MLDNTQGDSLPQNNQDKPTFQSQVENILLDMGEDGLGLLGGDTPEKRVRHISTTITDDEYRLLIEIKESRGTRYNTNSDVIYEMFTICLPVMYRLIKDQTTTGHAILKRKEMLNDHLRELNQHFEILDIIKRMGDVAAKLLQMGSKEETLDFIKKHIKIISDEPNKNFRKRYANVALESSDFISLCKQLDPESKPILSLLKSLAGITK